LPLGGLGTEGAPGTAGTEGTFTAPGAPGTGGMDGGAGASAVAPHDGQASADGSTCAPHLGHLMGPLPTVGGLKHIACSFPRCVLLRSMRLVRRRLTPLKISRRAADGRVGHALSISFAQWHSFSCGARCQQLL